MAFGLSCDIQDIDHFLINKGQKRVSYWGLRFLKLAERKLIMNQILASILWFFVIVWARTWKAIKNIKGLLRVYLWGGQLGHLRARVAWNDCCAKLKHGGLSLIDAEAATRNLLVQGCKVETSSIIQFRLENVCYDRGKKMESKDRMDVPPTPLAGTWVQHLKKNWGSMEKQAHARDYHAS